MGLLAIVSRGLVWRAGGPAVNWPLPAEPRTGCLVSHRAVNGVKQAKAASRGEMTISHLEFGGWAWRYDLAPPGQHGWPVLGQRTVIGAEARSPSAATAMSRWGPAATDAGMVAVTLKPPARPVTVTPVGSGVPLA